MTKILHVSQPTSAGVGNVVLDLARFQQTAGMTVAVACPQGALAGQLTEHGLPWRRWPSVRHPACGIRTEVASLRDIVAAERPDLVHLHSSKAGLIGRLVVRGTLPTVFQPHAWSTAAAGGVLRTGARAWEQHALRWTDLTLFCSHDEMRDGARSAMTRRGRIVLNGVDTALHRPPSPAEHSAARAALGLDPAAPIALLIGRNCQQKGQDVAVAAWPHVRRQVPGAVLALVGEGTETYRGHDGVTAFGHRCDIARVVAAADVVLCASRWEGLSLAMLEAMAGGRPVVATDVPGAREVLTRPGYPSAGAVVPVGSPRDIAAATVTRLLDPRRRETEGANARRIITENFTRERTFSSITDSYQAVLNDRSGLTGRSLLHGPVVRRPAPAGQRNAPEDGPVRNGDPAAPGDAVSKTHRSA